MGWNAGDGFSPFGTWVGYNEAMILYILALGSPTYPVPARALVHLDERVQVADVLRIHLPQLPAAVRPPVLALLDRLPLASRTCTCETQRHHYFENSRRATYAAQAYCIDNPLRLGRIRRVRVGPHGQDGPTGYNAHGAPPAQNDNGTITPTAAASSIAFAPEIVIPTLRYWYDNFPWLWGPTASRTPSTSTVAWVGPTTSASTRARSS
jgi:hypothetical protein